MKRDVSIRSMIESGADPKKIIQSVKEAVDPTVIPPGHGTGMVGNDQYGYDLSDDKFVNTVAETVSRIMVRESDEDPYAEEDHVTPVSHGAENDGGLGEEEHPETYAGDTSTMGEREVNSGGSMEGDYEESDMEGKDKLPKAAEAYLSAFIKAFRESAVAKFKSKKAKK